MSAVADSQSSATQIEDRAAHFLARRRYSTWQPGDQVELEAWLAASLSHRVAFWRLEATLARTERLAALQPGRPKKIGPEPRKHRFTLQIAAVVAFTALVGAASAFYFLRLREAVYTTPVGGHEILTLADGSVIELNTDTVLRLGARERTATLEKGEAYFQIRHDATHPFVVQTAGHRVVDLGTKFLIRSEKGRFEISLVEGLARVETAGAAAHASSALLRPGDVAIATAVAMKVEKKPTTVVARELGWRRGVIVFDNTTLADAAAEFNRYNHTKLLIADPAVGNLVIGATFPANDVERFARSARILLGVNVTRRGDDVVISR
jgi:transmembrane sensor